MPVKRLTNSEMVTWRECRRKWWLSHYRSLGLRDRHRFASPLSIGNRVHEALAAHYEPELKADPVQYVKDSIAADLEQYPEQASDIQRESELSVIMVEGYMQWLEEEGVDSAYEVVLGAEQAVEAPLPVGDPSSTFLLAKLDLRVRDLEGKLWGIDWKTGTTQTEPTTLQMNTQALTQHLVEYLHQGPGSSEEAKGTIFRVLRRVKRTARAKPPFYWQEEVRHSKQELESHWRHVLGTARDIEEATRRLDAGEDHHAVAYPHPTRDCSWKCPFYRICVQFDDGSNVEAAIEDLYEVIDPLARYSP